MGSNMTPRPGFRVLLCALLASPLLGCEGLVIGTGSPPGVGSGHGSTSGGTRTGNKGSNGSNGAGSTGSGSNGSASNGSGSNGSGNGATGTGSNNGATG